MKLHKKPQIFIVKPNIFEVRVYLYLGDKKYDENFQKFYNCFLNECVRKGFKNFQLDSCYWMELIFTPTSNGDFEFFTFNPITKYNRYHKKTLYTNVKALSNYSKDSSISFLRNFKTFFAKEII